MVLGFVYLSTKNECSRRASAQKIFNAGIDNPIGFRQPNDDEIEALITGGAVGQRHR
jgi:hypothetical protein